MKRSEAVRLLIERAGKYIGIKETHGSNRSPDIDRMNRFAGAPIASPWCASCVAEIGDTALGTIYPVPRSADCDVLLAWGRKRKLLHTRGAAGDIFLVLNSGDDNDARHTGIVTEATASGVKTIEGNTNNDGSREGKECMARFRSYNRNLVFLRWVDFIDDTAGEDPAEPGWKIQVGAATKQLPGVIDGNVLFVDFTDLMGVIFGAEAAKLIGWEPNEGGAIWAGKPLPSNIPRRLFNGETFVGVRSMGEYVGLETVADSGKKLATLKRPA